MFIVTNIVYTITKTLGTYKEHFTSCISYLVVWWVGRIAAVLK